MLLRLVYTVTWGMRHTLESLENWHKVSISRVHIPQKEDAGTTPETAQADAIKVRLPLCICDICATKPKLAKLSDQSQSGPLLLLNRLLFQSCYSCSVICSLLPRSFCFNNLSSSVCVLRTWVQPPEQWRMRMEQTWCHQLHIKKHNEKHAVSVDSRA